MIDPGSAVNLLPKRTYFKLVNVTSKLEESSIIVQGFDKHPQIPLGGINQQVRFGNLKTEAYFHVIDSNTSYKALFGRPLNCS